MKVCMFEIVNLQQVSPTQMRVAGVVPDVPVNPDLVAYLLPTFIPSDLNGPDGQPLPREVTRIQFAGGALLVDQPRELVLWRLGNDLVELVGQPAPTVREEPEPEPEDDAGPRRLQLRRPGQ